MTNFSLIYHKARKKLNLSVNEYIITDLVYHLSNHPQSLYPGWCYASKDYFAEVLGLTRRGIIKIINKLVFRGILERNDQNQYLRTTETWYQEVIINEKTCEQSSHVNKVHSEQSSHNNNKHSNNINTVTNVTSVPYVPLSNIACSRNAPCGHCSKCSLTPCTDVQIWEMAMHLNIAPTDVKSKHSAIMELIESGVFQKKYKKDKTVYYTLQTWLRMGIDRGYIQKLDETQRLYWLAQHPDKLRELNQLEKKLKKEGKL